MAAFSALAAVGLAPAPARAEAPAKQLFGAEKVPSAQGTQSIGFYAKGCLAGGVGLPLEGKNWQVVNPDRNRRWGHPATIAFLERLAARGQADGWTGLLVGDISQPRGGPMASGHASHQIGLDADIWFTPMPKRRLTLAERQPFQGASMLKKGTFQVDDARWTPTHLKIVKDAAEDPKVQRIFVHPGIKKKLCETAGRDRAWLNKVRPFYGHDQHFHVRLFCQPGSPGCDGQAETGTGDGCDGLNWWFNVALRPPPPPKPGAKPPKPRPPMTLAALPAACRTVLTAPDAAGTKRSAAADAPDASVPAISRPAPAAAALAPTPASGFPPTPPGDIPMPQASPME